jgi:hypothetical protein
VTARETWNREAGQLNLTLQAMNDTVVGHPTSMRITGLDDPAVFKASSPDGATVDVEPRGPDLLIRTTVGRQAILVAPQ